MKPLLLLICLLFESTVFAEIQPDEAKFLQEMNLNMKRMEHDMSAAHMSGNVDRDFAELMIPHHQAAIDMARSELLYGKDPVMRRLAEGILIEQQSEIDVMKLWLKNLDEATKIKVPNEKK